MRKQKPEFNPFLNGWNDIYQCAWSYIDQGGNGETISFWPLTT
ncbi:hypothetical protein LCGC14_2769190, partial [marine sediment metagenome]